MVAARKAWAGQMPTFTGINSPYEAPLQPELVIDTGGERGEDNAAFGRLEA
jgi:adenylylsulfate kinase-like enzyme